MKFFFSALGLSFLFSGAIFAADRVTVLQPSECHNGLGRFREHFKAYFNGVGEKYLEMKEEDIRAILAKAAPERYELELLAAPALPENLSFRLRRMSCWSEIYDFAENLETGKLDRATAKLNEWRACASNLYGGKPPAIVMDIKLCFEVAQKSGVIPKVLPATVKQPPKLEPSS